MSDVPGSPASTIHLSMTAIDSPSSTRTPEAIISIAGDLDRCGAPALEAYLAPLLASASSAMLTVDLARTDFVDVGGLNVLITAARRASAIGRPVRLVGCSPHVLRLLHIVEAVDLFGTVAGGDQLRMPPQTLPSTAHTVLPFGRSRTPHSVDKPATTSRPRPRGAVGSTCNDVGTGQG
jgi:anti-anti-sigma factor